MRMLNAPVVVISIDGQQCSLWRRECDELYEREQRKAGISTSLLGPRSRVNLTFGPVIVHNLTMSVMGIHVERLAFDLATELHFMFFMKILRNLGHSQPRSVAFISHLGHEH